MFSEIRSVHFVGICGTAMASAAAAMKEKGFAVTGSDQNVYPPMSTFLAERKIEVMPAYAEQNLAHKPDLVVVGNAMSRGNPEVEAVLEHKLRYCSLPELLKEFFMRGKRVHYLPEVAIINNLEFDHADIFTDLVSIQTSFSHFVRLVPQNGLLLA